MFFKTLQDLSPGESGVVGALTVSGDIRRRLLDLGLNAGSFVTCLFRAPSKSPGAYLIRGSVIALRKADGEKVSIITEPDSITKGGQYGGSCI